jgi:hypothetical protein
MGHSARKLGHSNQALEFLEKGLAVALPIAELENNPLGPYNPACYFSLQFFAHSLKYENPDFPQKQKREYFFAETIKGFKEVVDRVIATEVDIRRDINFEPLVKLREFEKLFDK